MTIFAHKGEEIRDTEGNLVATLARDVLSYEPISAEAFILPDGKHPVPGEAIPQAIWDFLDKKRTYSNQTE